MVTAKVFRSRDSVRLSLSSPYGGLNSLMLLILTSLINFSDDIYFNSLLGFTYSFMHSRSWSLLHPFFRSGSRQGLKFWIFSHGWGFLKRGDNLKSSVNSALLKPLSTFSHSWKWPNEIHLRDTWIFIYSALHRELTVIFNFLPSDAVGDLFRRNSRVWHYCRALYIKKSFPLSEHKETECVWFPHFKIIRSNFLSGHVYRNVLNVLNFNYSCEIVPRFL
jgi:hypothetical protein